MQPFFIKKIQSVKRYVIAGTGHRGISSYALPLVNELSDCALLCGVYDINPKRAALVAGMTKSDIPAYDDFDRMLGETKPDAVIVTTKDSAHDEYIVKALDAGCDVIVEKPITTDAEKLKTICEAEKRSGRHVTVTFNCRFSPFFVRIKELLAENIIGTVFSVHYEWMLDTSHGADYFRRWHRERKNSGSLLIHKASHHFDLLNWFLGDEPVTVSAFGSRLFYGPTREERSERCLTCPHKKTCEFYFNIENSDFYRKVYLDCEEEDGYFRDRCVFSDEIDIEDSVSVSIRYAKGAVVSYSLTAHSPYEGFKMVLNGENGRMEIINHSGTGAFAGKPEQTIRVYNRLDEEIIYRKPPGSKSSKTTKNADRLIAELSGGHGGSDPLMRDMIFRGADEDPLCQNAGTRAGAMSIAVGIAANISMAENRMVDIKQLYDFMDWE